MKKVLLQASETLLFPEGHITIAKNNQSLLQQLRDNRFDLVIIEELDLLEQIRHEFPRVPIVVAPLIGSISEAVDAFQKGAYDYKVKPLMGQHIEGWLQKLSAPAPKNRKLPMTKKNQHEVILFESGVMQKVLADIEKIAQSSAAVFISGESGTGKEVIAHAIHYQSPRVQRPFVKVNC